MLQGRPMDRYGGRSGDASFLSNTCQVLFFARRVCDLILRLQLISVSEPFISYESVFDSRESLISTAIQTNKLCYTLYLIHTCTVGFCFVFFSFKNPCHFAFLLVGYVLKWLIWIQVIAVLLVDLGVAARNVCLQSNFSDFDAVLWPNIPFGLPGSSTGYPACVYNMGTG